LGHDTTKMDPSGVAGGGGGVVRGLSDQAERWAGDLVAGVNSAGGDGQYVGVDRAGDDGEIFWGMIGDGRAGAGQREGVSAPHVAEAADDGMMPSRLVACIDKTGRGSEPSLFCAKGVRLWQVECSHQEDGHLGAGDWVLRTVVATATAGGDALRSQLLDPGGSPIADRHVIEAGAATNSGGNIGGTMPGAQEEDGHLGSGNRVIRAVAQRRGQAAGGDAISVEFLDPIDRPVGYRHIGEDGTGAGGRGVGGAAHAALQEDRHLGAGDRLLRAVTERDGAASGGDAGSIQAFDPRICPMGNRNICKSGRTTSTIGTAFCGRRGWGSRPTAPIRITIPGNIIGSRTVGETI